MRLKHKLMTVLIAVLVTLLPLSIVSYAAEDIEITLTGGAQHLKTSEDNLFKAFNGIVPGETRTQKINIHNDYARKAEFYLTTGKSVSAYDDLSSKVLLKLTRGSESETLYEGKLSDVPGRISLGYIPLGGSQTISLSLTLPSDIGSEAAGQSLSSRWHISADVYDTGGTGGGGTGGGGHPADPGYVPSGPGVVTPGDEPLIPGQTDVPLPGEMTELTDTQFDGTQQDFASPGAAGTITSPDTADMTPYFDTAVMRTTAEKSPGLWILSGLALLILCIALAVILARRKKGGDGK